MDNWTNRNNREFYDTLPIDVLKEIAHVCGLSEGCDLNPLDTHIAQASSILEIGAGYGRVIEHLLKKGFNGEVFAIERNKKLHRHLVEAFNEQPNVNILNTDLVDFIADRKFDLVLWLWASISEFSQAEQLTMLSTLYQHLENNGHLILDVVPESREPNSTTKISKGNYIFHTEYGKDYGYFPTHDEIITYAANLNINKIDQIHYKTDTNRERLLYVFSKPN